VDEQSFLDLSVALTGDSDLNAGLVEDHLRRLATMQPPTDLASLAAAWSAIAALPEPQRPALIASQIMAVPALAAIAKQIILLWYVGDPVPDLAAGRTSAQYFGGILWRIARAHPPALSGGYFGHWTYGPDAQ
jgi:hypothetical protein